MLKVVLFGAYLVGAMSKAELQKEIADLNILAEWLESMVTVSVEPGSADYITAWNNAGSYYNENFGDTERFIDSVRVLSAIDRFGSLVIAKFFQEVVLLLQAEKPTVSAIFVNSISESHENIQDMLYTSTVNLYRTRSLKFYNILGQIFNHDLFKTKTQQLLDGFLNDVSNDVSQKQSNIKKLIGSIASTASKQALTDARTNLDGVLKLLEL
jgi:hypothetical protein